MPAVPSDPLLPLADSFIPRFSRTFEQSVLRLRESVSEALVQADLEAGLLSDPERLMRLVSRIEIAKAESNVYAELVAAAAKAEVGRRPLREAMTVQSPFVQRAAQRLSAQMVRGVKDETRRAIRQIVFEAIRDGDPPARSQWLIRQIVGLTERDAVAVKRLAENGMSERQVARYSQRLLRARAMNIARTETIRAGNVGRVEGWKQMQRDGLLAPDFQERWMVTYDDRLCERCAPMDGLTVSLGGRFEETARGVLPSERVPVSGVTTDTPPLHPQCRCTLVAA